MNKEFVNYEQSLKLKELGFDEECFGYYTGDKMHLVIRPSMSRINVPDSYIVTAPTFSQAFRWIRNNYKRFKFNILYLENSYYGFCIFSSDGEKLINGSNEWKIEDETCETYEESELVCLNKIIEIIGNEVAEYKNGVPTNWD